MKEKKIINKMTMVKMIKSDVKAALNQREKGYKKKKI